PPMSRRQKTEDAERKSEVGNRKPEVRGQRSEVGGRKFSRRHNHFFFNPRSSVLSLLTSVLCLLSAGCLRHEPPADVTIVNGAEPESLDPAIVTGIPEMRITRALFDGLLRIDAKTARPVPALAERWEISPD